MPDIDYIELQKELLELCDLTAWQYEVVGRAADSIQKLLSAKDADKPTPAQTEVLDLVVNFLIANGKPGLAVSLQAVLAAILQT